MLATPASIDVVAKEKGERDFKLVLEVDRGEWALPRALWLLEEKLNAYASFALDGQMRQLYPASAPDRTRILVVSADPLPEKAVWLLEKVRLGLKPHGIGLVWDQPAPVPPPSSGAPAA